MLLTIHCFRLPSPFFKYWVIITWFTPKALLPSNVSCLILVTCLTHLQKMVVWHSSSFSLLIAPPVHIPSGRGVLCRQRLQAGFSNLWKELLFGPRWIRTIYSVGSWFSLCHTISLQWNVAQRVTVWEMCDLYCVDYNCMIRIMLLRASKFSWALSPSEASVIESGNMFIPPTWGLLC